MKFFYNKYEKGGKLSHLRDKLSKMGITYLKHAEDNQRLKDMYLAKGYIEKLKKGGLTPTQEIDTRLSLEKILDKRYKFYNDSLVPESEVPLPTPGALNEYQKQEQLYGSYNSKR